MTARHLPRLAPGDRVRYSSEFCRTVGAATGWAPQARGVITRLWGQGSEFAAILWEFPGPDGRREGGAHLSALERSR
jgi:hypothetical protein